jgi:membrane protein YqaA with SNARE-associated domain
MARASGPNALWVLALVAFVESSLFPIPPDVLIIPMVLAARKRAWLIAGVCTVASVSGGVLGYAIGAFLWDTVGQPVMTFYGYGDKFAVFQAGAGLTPFPYKVITIASGAVDLNMAVFMVASILSRGARFLLVAALLWYFGEPIRMFIEKRLGLLTALFFVLLFGGFLALKVLA